MFVSIAHRAIYAGIIPDAKQPPGLATKPHTSFIRIFDSTYRYSIAAYGIC
jgi:hypothetical protein